LALGTAHEGYEYQDYLTVGYIMQEMIKGSDSIFIIDKKDSKNDKFDDLKIIKDSTTECIQIKYSNEEVAHKLSYYDLSNGNGHDTALDTLFFAWKELKRKYANLSFELCVAWDQPDKLDNDIRDIVIYARVSTRNQKDDLLNQVEFLKQFCNAKGIIVNQCIEDFGSGLNYNRKKWNKLLEEVMENRIKTIVISSKDRFIRFGYDWFEKFCEKFNTKIIIVNNEALSPNEEIVQDIISILHVFSCRLYGLRKYKNQIKEDEEIAKELQNGNKSNVGTNTKDK